MYHQDTSSCTTTDRVTQTIQDHPDEVMLTAFATGAIIGLAIGSALAGSSSPTWRNRQVAEGLGERVMDSLDRVLPNSVAGFFGKN